MESMNNDLERTRRRARLRYEWVRARRAVVGFLPALGLVAAACAFNDRPLSALGFGFALFAVGVTVLWYGRAVRRAVLPGLVAGVAPLLLVLGAPHVDHQCDSTTCTSLCLAACIIGGALAGLVVGASKAGREGGAGFWIVASSLALLTGAMACARLGIAGLGGLLVGYGTGMLPSLIRRTLSNAQ